MNTKKRNDQPRGEECSTAAKVNQNQEFRERSALSAARRALKSILGNAVAGWDGVGADSVPPMAGGKPLGVPPAGPGDFWVLHPGGEILFRARVQPGRYGGLLAYIFETNNFRKETLPELGQWLPIENLAKHGWIEWVARGKATAQGA